MTIMAMPYSTVPKQKEKNSRSHQISCLSGPNSQVYATNNYGDIGYLPNTSYCRKMYNVRSIPYYILIGHDQVFELKWNNPDCRKCEVKGKNCRLKNKGNGTETIECFLRQPKHTKMEFR
jgi:hypothetical protein